MWVNVEEGTIYGDFYKASKEVQNNENSKFLMTKKTGNKSNRFGKQYLNI